MIECLEDLPFRRTLKLSSEVYFSVMYPGL